MGNTNGVESGLSSTSSSSSPFMSIPPRSATGIEIQNIKYFQRRIQEQYDPQNESHVKLLQRLWTLASFDGPFSQKDEHHYS